MSTSRPHRLKALDEVFNKPPVEKVKPYIPSAFLADGPFNAIDAAEYSVSVPVAGGTGTFRAPSNDYPESLGKRARNYGVLVATREGVIRPKADLTQAAKEGLHASWVAAAHSTIVDELLISRGIEEIRDLPIPAHAPLGEIGLWALAQTALIGWNRKFGTQYLGAIMKRMRELRYKSAAKKLGALRAALIHSAFSGVSILPVLREMEHVFGSPDKIAPKQDPEKKGKEDEGKVGRDKKDSVVEKLSIDGFLGKLLGDDGSFEALMVPMPALPTSEAEWGPMRIQPIPFTLEAEQRKTAKRHRRSIAGSFRFPWRALPCSDMNAFAIRRRAPGGTLLLDMSGSMRIDNEDMDALLNVMPQLTVAAYGSNGSDSQSGVLAIVIQKGQRVESSKKIREYIGGGNVVDGPALRWLITQNEPRVWVSDGSVTGKGDVGGENLRREAAEISAFGHVTRVHSIRKLFEMLTPD